MCEGVAIARRDVPDVLLQGEIARRLVTRSAQAEPELQFLYRDRPSLLPVVWNGKLQIITWGSQDKRSQLPRAGECRIEHLEAGRLAWLQPEPVDIPACFGWERGVWYQITEGLRGLVIRDEQGRPHAYLLSQPATHYYHIMTRHDRMPVLIGQTI